MEKNMTFKAKKGYKFLVSGTEFNVESIYVRTRWSRSLDGEKVEVQGNVYLSKEKFKENENNTLSVVVVELKTGNSINIPPMGNYGVHKVPADYDNNDLTFSHLIIISNFQSFAELLID